MAFCIQFDFSWCPPTYEECNSWKVKIYHVNPNNCAAVLNSIAKHENKQQKFIAFIDKIFFCPDFTICFQLCALPILFFGCCRSMTKEKLMLILGRDKQILPQEEWFVVYNFRIVTLLCGCWVLWLGCWRGTRRHEFETQVPIYYFHNLLLMSYHREIRDKSNTLKNDPYVQLKS